MGSDGLVTRVEALAKHKVAGSANAGIPGRWNPVRIEGCPDAVTVPHVPETFRIFWKPGVTCGASRTRHPGIPRAWRRLDTRGYRSVSLRTGVRSPRRSPRGLGRAYGRRSGSGSGDPPSGSTRRLSFGGGADLRR